MLANPYSGVGTCSAGQYVNALTRNAAPSCSTPAAGSFAPLTNPAGGQNNYAPLASPTFTGTVTIPDASTITSAGYNNVKAMGIGGPVAAPTAGQTIPFRIASVGSTTWTATNLSLNAGSSNQANVWTLLNPNLTSGTGLYSAYYADYCDPALGTACTGPNDFYVAMQANGAGSTVATPLSGVFQTSAPAGMQINNIGNSPLTLYSGGRIDLKSNAALVASYSSGLQIGAPTGGDKGTGTVNVSGGFYVNGTLIGASSGTVTSVALSGGTTGLTVSGSPITTSGTMTLGGTLAIANGGTGATTAGAALTNLGAAPLASPTFTGTMTFPDGSTYTASGHNNMKALGIGGAVGSITSGDALDIVSNVATGGSANLQNTNAGSGVLAVWQAGNGTYQTYVGTAGTGYSINANFPANQGQLVTNAVNGLAIASVDNVSTAPIKLWASGGFVATFLNGLVMGAATGGDKGAGTINVSGGFYVNGVAVGAGSVLPNGAPPQLVGYSATNTGEAETISGDATLARAGTNSYTITVSKTAGTAFGALATLGVGTGLTSSAGNLNLTTPVSVANGGYGSGTAPSAAQIPIAQSATSYTPNTVSGDATLASTGALTVTKTNGTAFSALATASVPLSIANGGRGSSTAPTTGQIDVASSATAFTPVTMSGDGTITSAGVLTVTKLNATTPGGTCTGGQFVSSISTSGVPTCTTPSSAGGYPAGAPPQIAGFSATNTAEAETLSGDATLTRAGLNSYTISVTKTAGTAFTALATASIPLSIANGGRGSTTAPVVGQIDVASSTTAFTPVTMSGDATITSAGVLTVSKIAGITPGGSCTGNQYVLSISASGVPTCGSLLAPLASPTFTGTITFPDSSTYTSGGLNNMLGLGIGMVAAGNPSSQPIAITENYNGNTVIALNNTSTGTAAVAGLYLTANSGTTSAYFAITGTGFTTSSWQKANEAYIYSGLANGLTEVSAGTGPINFWINGTQQLALTTTGLTAIIPFYSNVTPNSASAGNINTASSTITLATGTNAAIAGSCSGMFQVTDTSVSGDAGLYLCGGGGCTFVTSSRGGTTMWGASSTAPPSGHASMAGNGANYAIYNNQGSTVTYGVTAICSRAGY